MKIKNFKKLYIFYLLSIIVGNIIVISIAKPIGINPRYFSIPYRIYIFLFSLYILYYERKKINFKNISVLSLILFWFYYIFKLIYSFDNFYFDPQISVLQNEIILRVLMINLIPSIALLAISYDKVDFKSLAYYSVSILFGLLILNYLYEYVKLDYIFSTYYIMYGHIGASLFIISLFLLLFENKDYRTKIFLLLCLFLGFFNIIQSTARSPLLAIIICAFYLLVLKRNIKYILYFIGLFSLLMTTILLHETYGDHEIVSFNRMYKWIVYGDTSNRSPLFNKAIEIFKSNYLFGGRVLYEDGVHPHNIFLELLMSTGVLGLFFYFLKFWPILKNFSIFWNMKKGIIYYKLIFALFLQYFILMQTSCNLFSLPEFLYFSSIIIGLRFKNV